MSTALAARAGRAPSERSTARPPARRRGGHGWPRCGSSSSLGRRCWGLDEAPARRAAAARSCTPLRWLPPSVRKAHTPDARVHRWDGSVERGSERARPPARAPDAGPGATARLGSAGDGGAGRRAPHRAHLCAASPGSRRCSASSASSPLWSLLVPWLLGRFPAREVGIVGTVVDMAAVTIAVYVGPRRGRPVSLLRVGDPRRRAALRPRRVGLVGGRDERDVPRRRPRRRHRRDADDRRPRRAGRATSSASASSPACSAGS